MLDLAAQQPSGHVFRHRGTQSDSWFAKYRLSDGRQVRKKIRPTWDKRGRPPAGYFTKRSAEAWLAEVLDSTWQPRRRPRRPTVSACSTRTH